MGVLDGGAVAAGGACPGCAVAGGGGGKLPGGTAAGGGAGYPFGGLSEFPGGGAGTLSPGLPGEVPGAGTGAGGGPPTGPPCGAFACAAAMLPSQRANASEAICVGFMAVRPVTLRRTAYRARRPRGSSRRTRRDVGRCPQSAAAGFNNADAAGARGRSRTDTLLRAADFRTTSAYAAPRRSISGSWSGARLHRSPLGRRCPPSALYTFLRACEGLARRQLGRTAPGLHRV